MNRIVRTTALALATTFALAACKGGDQPASAPSADAPAAQPSGEVVAMQVTGAGSSFVAPVLSKWSDDYNKSTGHKINYQSIGSGGGIAQIEAGTVDFGASDKPLSAEELQKFGLGQFPVVIGGIVPVANIDGVAPGQLRLTGAVLADIYLGKVAKWNDPAISALNPGLALPAATINVVHRSDGSGTTFNFTDYLGKVSGEWKSKVGEGTAVNWPTGIGGKGNEGVAAYVKQLKGAIGYVEYAYALQNKLTFAQMRNAAGNFVSPKNETFSEAAASADWAHAQDFELIMTNAPGANAWPITATTWAIMYKQPKNPVQAQAALDFFKWSFENGQSQAATLDYVPLPKELVQQVEQYWSTEFKH
ncbi:MAG TPA: phosphate ABC transporter substrate-binding protein PstS [Lysobacter sp.]|nr:phosphate ABC transporter substrate-binding protein PstS [Lysobacter sp.]